MLAGHTAIRGLYGGWIYATTIPQPRQQALMVTLCFWQESAVPCPPASRHLRL